MLCVIFGVFLLLFIVWVFVFIYFSSFVVGGVIQSCINASKLVLTYTILSLHEMLFQSM